MSEPDNKKTNPFSDFALAFAAATTGYSVLGHTLTTDPGAKYFFIGTLITGGAGVALITAGKVWETYKKPVSESPPKSPAA